MINTKIKQLKLLAKLVHHNVLLGRNEQFLALPRSTENVKVVTLEILESTKIKMVRHLANLVHYNALLGRNEQFLALSQSTENV